MGRPDQGYKTLAIGVIGKPNSMIPDMAGQPHAGEQPSLDPLTSAAKQLFRGIVVRDGAGLHDCSVKVMEKVLLACTVSVGVSGARSGMGVTTSYIPAAGTEVLVFCEDIASRRGHIIAVIAPVSDGRPATGNQTYPDVPLNASDIPTYSRAMLNPLYRGKLAAYPGKTVDTFPGDLAHTSDFGAGTHVGMLSSALFAGADARVECFVLDSLVRLVALSQLQQITPLGHSLEFNDEGRVTRIEDWTSHSCETLGLSEFKETAKDAPAKAMMRRFVRHTGFLGGLCNMWVLNPAESETAQDSGLFHAHISESGSALVRTAGDFVLQRTDRIAVPKRLREPWDPAGDKAGESKAKKPWKWSDPAPAAIAAQQRDHAAYLAHQAMQRYREADKDWRLPEERELPLPDDKTDTLDGGASQALEQADKVTSCLSMLKGGGFMLSDNCGGQIVMRDGQCIITAPNGVSIQSGKAIHAVAGTEVVMTAKGSVDIESADKDVRVAAKRNVQVLSREAGVLIESTAAADDPLMTEKGEKAESRGVVIKAENSRVWLRGATVHLSALLDVLAETVGSATGAIRFVTEKLTAVARQLCFTGQTATGKAPVSGVFITDSGVNIGGVSATIAADSVGVYQGSDTFSLGEVTTAGPAPLATTKLNLSREAKGLEREKGTWLSPYSPKQQPDFTFTFRDKSEYDTTNTLVEPLWATLERAGGATLTELGKREHAKTYPWPGKDAEMKKLSSERNVDTATGLPKQSADIVATGGAFESVAATKWPCKSDTETVKTHVER